MMGSYANNANRVGRTDHAVPFSTPTTDPYNDTFGEAEAVRAASRAAAATRATVEGEPFPQEPAEDRTGNF